MMKWGASGRCRNRRRDGRITRRFGPRRRGHPEQFLPHYSPLKRTRRLSAKEKEKLNDCDCY